MKTSITLAILLTTSGFLTAFCSRGIAELKTNEQVARQSLARQIAQGEEINLAEFERVSLGGTVLPSIMREEGARRGFKGKELDEFVSRFAPENLSIALSHPH